MHLRQLGFKIINVPRAAIRAFWPGISYVNSLVVNRDLYLPSAGFLRHESKVYEKLSAQIPDFKLHFVPAFSQIVKNGGVHCSAKAIR